MKEYTQLHERLKELRINKSLSQDEIAELVGITQATYNRTENGKTKPREITIKKLADALEVNYEWLLTGRGNMREDEIKTLRPINVEDIHPVYLIEKTLLASEEFNDIKQISMNRREIYLPGLDKAKTHFGILIDNRNHEPELREGSTIVLHQIKQSEFENGKYYLLIIGNIPILRKVSTIIGGADSGKFKITEGSESQIISGEEIQRWFKITHSLYQH